MSGEIIYIMVNIIGDKFMESKEKHCETINWWEDDKYLSTVITNNMELFSEHVNLEGNVLNALPMCRKLARKDFLDEDSMSYIVSYCKLDNSVEILDYRKVESFLYEEIGVTFCNVIVKQIKDFISKFPSGIKDSEICDYLTKCLWSLNGSTSIHYITNGLKVYDCFE